MNQFMSKEKMKKAISNGKKWLLNFSLIALTALIAAGIGSQAPVLYKKWKGPYKNGDYSSHFKDKPYALTLYGTTTCPHCKRARTYLSEKKIAFNDVLIDQSNEANLLFEQLNESGVPVLISHDKLFVGFQAKVYDDLIQRESKN
jgi:glutaredoxin